MQVAKFSTMDPLSCEQLPRGGGNGVPSCLPPANLMLSSHASGFLGGVQVLAHAAMVLLPIQTLSHSPWPPAAQSDMFSPEVKLGITLGALLLSMLCFAHSIRLYINLVRGWLRWLWGGCMAGRRMSSLSTALLPWCYVLLLWGCLDSAALLDALL